MKDLFIRRMYTHKGISVVMDIDLIKKTATMTETDQWHNKTKAKNWVFAGRSYKYMDGWMLILDAMKHATKEAKKVLEEEEKRNEERFMEILLAVGGTLDDNKKGKK
jgi:hypothetical protein